MRREFPSKVRLARWEHSGGHCEYCDIKIPHSPHYDHAIADAIGGEPTFDNCRVACRTCHDLKTHTEDIPKIAKSKRVRAKHVNARDKRRGFKKPPKGYNAWTRRIEHDDDEAAYDYRLIKAAGLEPL